VLPRFRLTSAPPVQVRIRRRLLIGADGPIGKQQTRPAVVSHLPSRAFILSAQVTMRLLEQPRRRVIAA
jgi:hypothetical protein